MDFKGQVGICSMGRQSTEVGRDLSVSVASGGGTWCVGSRGEGWNGVRLRALAARHRSLHLIHWPTRDLAEVCSLKK